jgi:hypothetical protein
VPLKRSESDGRSLNRALRVVDVTPPQRGLRVRSAEVGWGDSGLGQWLCCIGVEDRTVAPPSALDETGVSCGGASADVDAAVDMRPERLLDISLEVRYGHLDCTLETLETLETSDSQADGVRTRRRTTFTQVQMGGQAARAGVMRGDELVAVEGAIVSDHEDGTYMDRTRTRPRRRCISLQPSPTALAHGLRSRAPLPRHVTHRLPQAAPAAGPCAASERAPAGTPRT